MDEYEVTVGRFWNFLDAYDAWIAGKNPAPGAGEHLVGAGSGWQTDWTSSLPLSSAVFQDSKHLECDASMLTLIGGERNRPINCVSWYEAFAFCIWDGGRLATDAEWEYAARNGSKLTAYPWGNTPEPNNNLAVYVCQGDGDPSGCSINDIAPVGSVQQGNNSYGQADLAGNVWEWVTDAFSNYPSTCDNCVISSGLGRVYRGGGYDNRSNYLGSRTYIEPTRRTLDLGIRCVRSVQ